MPRPVVPMARLPRNRSVTLSSTWWYGATRWALAETRSREVSAPRACRPSISCEQCLQVHHAAVADDRHRVRAQDAGGKEFELVLLAADDDGVPGVVAAVGLDDVVDASAEQVGGLSLTLVAPLGSDDHDSWHGILPHQSGARPICPAGHPYPAPCIRMPQDSSTAARLGFPRAARHKSVGLLPAKFSGRAPCPADAGRFCSPNPSQ